MKLTISRSKNSTSFYVHESYRNEKGHSTTRVVEKLGTAEFIKSEYGVEDPEKWAREYVANLNKELKQKKQEELANVKNKQVNITLYEGKEYAEGEKRSFNVGYLAIQKALYSLGFKDMCSKISDKYKFEYNLERIVAELIYGRIMNPCSKEGTFEHWESHSLEEEMYDQHQIYRSLDVLHQESDFIQSYLYKASNKVTPRNFDAVYYDCTNFYFEIDEEDELRKYGASKEHRPNPIVQMGLFMDGSGLPMCFNINPENTNEQTTLIPLEKKIIEEFNNNKAPMIVCTDVGLASITNKKFNSTVYPRRHFIVTQSLKELDKTNQDWALDHGRSLIKEPIQPHENSSQIETERNFKCWHLAGSSELYSLDDIDENAAENYNKIFYKERIIKSTASSESKDSKSKNSTFEQRLIVSYSLRYKNFLERKRQAHIARAEKIIQARQCRKVAEDKIPSDCAKLIQVTHKTKDGQTADKKEYSLNQDYITNEARFDGFYAVTTSLSADYMSISDIVKINRRRWEIEESFMIMKSYMRARPVYLQREERIKAHFLTCFMSLLVFRIMEKQINNLAGADGVVTADNIIITLRDMNVTKVANTFYIGAFEYTQTAKLIQENLGMCFNVDYMSFNEMKKNIRNSKKG